MNGVWDEWADFYAEEDLASEYMEICDAVESFVPRGAAVADMGCGTGNFVLHLSRRGYTVFGVDSSKVMLERAHETLRRGESLLANPPCLLLDDMVTVQFDVGLDAIVSIHSTLYSLETVERQLQFYQNAVEQLGVGGYLITDAYVPRDTFLFPAKSLEVDRLGVDELSIHASAVNLITQSVMAQVLYFTKGSEVCMRTIHQRYIWPAEQRLMAKFAGLVHVAEWEDWRGTPTNNRSARTIQIYRKI